MTGTKQGCVLAPNIFTIFLTVVLIRLKLETSKDVYIRTKHDQKLFNLERLRAKTKNKEK